MVRISFLTYFHKYTMGCNCNKDGIPLSVKTKVRKEIKKKIADVKRIWRDSASSGTITTDKKELKFK